VEVREFDAGIVRVPVIRQNFCILLRASQKTITVFLSCSLELPSLFRVRNRTENLRYR